MTLTLRAAVVLAGVLLCAEGVRAQTDNRVAVGVSGGMAGAPNSLVDGHPRLGPLMRIGTGEEGWAGRIGFNWYGADLEETIGDDVHAFGRMRVRPFMYGYGYTKAFGPVHASAAMLGGFAFTSFRFDPAFGEAYRAALGVDNLLVNSGPVLVLNPEVSAWADVSDKIGVNVTFGYLIARPEVRIRSEHGVDARPIHADVFLLNVGMVYAIF